MYKFYQLDTVTNTTLRGKRYVAATKQRQLLCIKKVEFIWIIIYNTHNKTR